MWGQVIFGRQLQGNHRIIPTRVGTRVLRKKMVLSLEDHPHACGDKLASHIFLFVHQGSSPRVWGQDDFSVNFVRSKRIIPTRVGTSSKNCRIIFIFQDHPHACGDKSIPRNQSFITMGSSPRVWGQASEITRKKADKGIIPTRVGTRKQNVVERGQT